MKKILRGAERVKYRAKCNYCDTEFEYEISDVKSIFSIHLMSNMRVVTCPCCERELAHLDSVRSNISTESL